MQQNPLNSLFADISVAAIRASGLVFGWVRIFASMNHIYDSADDLAKLDEIFLFNGHLDQFVPAARVYDKAPGYRDLEIVFDELRIAPVGNDGS